MRKIVNLLRSLLGNMRKMCISKELKYCKCRRIKLHREFLGGILYRNAELCIHWTRCITRRKKSHWWLRLKWYRVSNCSVPLKRSHCERRTINYVRTKPKRLRSVWCRICSSFHSSPDMASMFTPLNLHNRPFGCLSKKGFWRISRLFLGFWILCSLWCPIQDFQNDIWARKLFLFELDTKSNKFTCNYVFSSAKNHVDTATDMTN